MVRTPDEGSTSTSFPFSKFHAMRTAPNVPSLRCTTSCVLSPSCKIEDATANEICELSASSGSTALLSSNAPLPSFKLGDARPSPIRVVEPSANPTLVSAMQNVVPSGTKVPTGMGRDTLDSESPSLNAVSPFGIKTVRCSSPRTVTRP